MVKTLAALYKDAHAAQQVVEALLDSGFSGDDISLLVKNAQGSHDGNGEMSAGDGAGLGALVGALVGIGSALVPGMGPLIGNGPLAVVVTAGIGAAAGALTGGISAGLIDLGSDDDAAHDYEDGLRGTAVSVTTQEEWLEWAYNIMNRYHPLKIEEREAKWYTSGWSAHSETVNEHEITSETNMPITQTIERSPSNPAIKRVNRVQIYNN
jgi:hypothetical protein